MKIREFSFPSATGVCDIQGFVYLPEDEVYDTVLVINHGMAEEHKRYEGFAQYLCENGVAVYIHDMAGHGKSCTDPSLTGWFGEKDGYLGLVDDLHTMVKRAVCENEGRKIFVMGHSMGSFILRNYMYRYGTGINGAIVMGTGMQPRALLAVSRAIAAISGFVLGDDHIPTLLNSMAFGAYNKRIPDAKNDYEWLSKVDEVQQKYIADSDCGFTFTVNGFKVLFKLIWKLTDKANVEKMPRNLPVFMVSGEEDPVGNYGEAVKQVYESYKALGMEDVTLKLYKDDRHEILNETDHDQVYEDILNWIEAHISA